MFANHQYWIPAIFIGLITFPFVAGRIYTRIWVLHRFGLDDCFLIFTELCSLAMTCIACYSMIVLGAGLHIQDFNLDNLIPLMKQSYAFNLCYVLAIFAVRMALLIQLLALVPHRKMKHALYVLVGVTIAAGIAQLFSNIFICLMWRVFDPKNSHLSGDERLCVTYWGNAFAWSALGTVLDVLIWLAPLRVVWKTRINETRKREILILFSMGALFWISSLVRFVYLLASDIRRKFPLDPAYLLITSGMLSMAEIHIGIIVICVPIVYPFLKRRLGKVQDESHPLSHSPPHGFPQSFKRFFSNNTSSRSPCPLTLTHQCGESHHYTKQSDSKAALSEDLELGVDYKGARDDNGTIVQFPEAVHAAPIPVLRFDPPDGVFDPSERRASTNRIQVEERASFTTDGSSVGNMERC